MYSDALSLILFLSVIYAILLTSSIAKDPKFKDTIPLLAFYISLISVLVSTGFATRSEINKKHDNLKIEQYRKEEEKYRNKEEEHKNKEEINQYLRKSIDLFYIPLLNLLEKNNIDLIITVNSHRYLAQPRIRYLFEEYLETNKNKEKIIKLAHRDLEELQNELIKK